MYAMPKLPVHGTVQRYRLELKDKTVCDRCRAANTRAKRQQRARQRQAGARPLLSIVGDVQPARTSEATPGDPAAEPAPAEYHEVPAWSLTEQAVNADLAGVPTDTPFYHSLRAAALVLAREIDDVNSRASKAPLVKQLVDVIRELKGKEGGDGESFEELLAGLAAPPEKSAAADRHT